MRKRETNIGEAYRYIDNRREDWSLRGMRGLECIFYLKGERRYYLCIDRETRMNTLIR